LTEVQVRIHGPRVVREISLIVDTGSEDTWIRRSLLEELGLKPRFARTYRTISNARVQRQVGPVEIECLGIQMPCPTVYADDEDANVLGVTALEILGLQIDPRTREVRQAEVLAAY
jgi:predicted aspartyl protease